MTYKLYTRVDISGVNNIKFPEFKGFLAQEIEIDPNTQWDMENYEGLNYRTAVLKQTILYPQQSGEIEIESGSFDLIFRIRNTNQRMRSLFDDFLILIRKYGKPYYRLSSGFRLSRFLSANRLTSILSAAA